jgi:hypothetical protein
MQVVRVRLQLQQSMILRITQKLAAKVKIPRVGALPQDPNPFADWTAALFTAARAQYVLFTNTVSLYSVISHGAGITTAERLIDRGTSCIRESMIDDGLELAYLQHVASSTASVRFSKTLSRSVTGSMNDMIAHAKFWLADGELSPWNAACRLNEIPMSALGYRNSREKLWTLEMPGGTPPLTLYQPADRRDAEG